MIWRIVQLLGLRIAPKLKLILMNKKENSSTFMTAESFTSGDRFLFIPRQYPPRPLVVFLFLFMVTLARRSSALVWTQTLRPAAVAAATEASSFLMIVPFVLKKSEDWWGIVQCFRTVTCRRGNLAYLRIYPMGDTVVYQSKKKLSCNWSSTYGMYPIVTVDSFIFIVHNCEDWMQSQICSRM